MNQSDRRAASRPLAPPIFWLMAIAIACLLAVIGLKLLFESLQAELEAKRSNEQARLFVGEEILSGIQGLEKQLYLMALSSNPAKSAQRARPCMRRLIAAPPWPGAGGR